MEYYPKSLFTSVGFYFEVVSEKLNKVILTEANKPEVPEVFLEPLRCNLVPWIL